MENTNSFLRLLVAVLAASVFMERSLADLLPKPELLPDPLRDLPKTPIPSLPPLAPILPPVPILPPAPLPHPPIPTPDLPCYPALFTCKNISTSDPSEKCCDNLKLVYENGTDCICKVVGSLELSKELSLNNNDISTLLVECKITNTSTSICTNAAPPPPPPPPNGASFGAEWIGFSTFFSLLFIMTQVV